MTHLIFEDKCGNCEIFHEINADIDINLCQSCQKNPSFRVLFSTSTGGKAILFKQYLDKKSSDLLRDHCQGKNVKLYDFKWYGRSMKQNRLIWSCGDKGVVHKFGGVSVPVNDWDFLFQKVRDLIHRDFDIYTNFCLQNTYPDGSYSIPAHSDGELLAKNKFVGTISLGCTRKMRLTGNNINIPFDVEHGDLFIMCGDDIQATIKHGIDKDLSINERRDSLTFRGAFKR